MHIGITCAILRNLGILPRINDLLTILEGKGDKRDLFDLIILVKYVEIFEILFFKDHIMFSICWELTGAIYNELGIEVLI